MKVQFVCSVAILAILSVPAFADPGDAPKIASKVVGNTPRVSEYGDSVVFAGQPDPASFKVFAEQGVEKVINLRSEGEIAGLDFDEAKVVEQNGMHYVNINVLQEGVGTKNVEAILDELDKDPGKKTLIHCASSNRVGFLWAIYRATRNGLTTEAAIAEGNQAGMSAPKLEARARKYIADAAN